MNYVSPKGKNRPSLSERTDAEAELNVQKQHYYLVHIFVGTCHEMNYLFKKTGSLHFSQLCSIQYVNVQLFYCVSFIYL